jgi:hypothetical protein
VKCPHCGQENDKESLFCKKCGKEINSNESADNKNSNVYYYEKPSISGDAFAGILNASFAVLFIFIALEEQMEFFIILGLFFLFGSLALFFIVFNLVFSQKSIRIKLEKGETILMVRDSPNGDKTILTNKSIVCQGRRRIKWEYSLMSKEIDIQLRTNFWGKQKGIAIKQKYEDKIEIDLEKPQKWFDKILEIRNSK